MAQHDYQISNGSGLAVRGDVNNALAAIVTQNSGDTAPSPTYPFMWWADSSAGHLKQRNAANTAWIDHGLLSKALLREGDVSGKRIGEPFIVFDHLSGADIPDNSAGSEKYVKLTKGLTGAGQYNEGLLASETETGSGPLLVATAVIVLGPMSGETIHLLNTEGRYIKPGTSSGLVANDQMQKITGNLSATGRMVTDGGTTSSGAITSSASGSGSVAAGPGSIYYRYMSFDSAGSPGARTGDFTDVKNQQGSMYVRIV
ncbi:hypothetical protein [Thalassospira marina]|uniref:Uncharacterized protein n=1 Tax=Thalassospira marina TaxID=2048283 RepID=A0A2N3KV05_9PROT|nr:hypothetical protein [Thalassospira marina]PKR54395.1 hypothetical protein COO20_09705 [Thalassospira marina]